MGKTPFATINLMMPFLILLGIVGFMLGTGGIWFSVTCAEILALLLSTVFLVKNRERYHY